MLKAIDLGGSTVRLCNTKGNCDTFASNFLEIPVGSMTKSYLEDKLTDFVIEEHPIDALKGRRFVLDDAIHQYDGKILNCDNQNNKTQQESIYVYCTYALAKDMVKYNRVNPDYKLGACIPTSEFYSGETSYPELFRESMAGHHAVYFPLLNKRVEFDLDNDGICIFPEDVVAAYRYAGVKEFIRGVTLVVGVGFRSTDITLLNNMKPAGKSAVSRLKGGITIEAQVKRDLERANLSVNTKQVRQALTEYYVKADGEYHNISEEVYDHYSYPEENRLSHLQAALKNRGIDTTIDVIAEAIKHRYVYLKSDYVDITDYIINARRSLASDLKQDIIDVLSTEMMNVSSIENIFCMGRPFAGGADDENSLAMILCEELGAAFRYFDAPPTGTSNAEEIIKVMKKMFKDDVDCE